MLSLHRITSLSLVLLGVFLLGGCGKEQAPGSSTGTTPVFDTAAPGKPVAVENAGHFVFYRPPVGEVFRYRMRVVSGGEARHMDSLFGTYPPHEKLMARTTLYMRHTIRQIRQDSTIDIAFRFDTIQTITESGDKKSDFSSAREADLKNPQFANAAAIVGKDLGAIITRNGDIVELYGTSAILAKLMSALPDSVRTTEVQDRLSRQVQATISEYLQKTLTHFPNKTLGKDTSWGGAQTQNTLVWQNVMYPTMVESREVVRGFEERNGKVLVTFDATTSVKPTQAVMDQGTAKTTLNSFELLTKATSNVEDATGVLVYRKITQDRSTNFMIESKSKPAKRYQVVSKANETTTIELLQ